jgi:hypothetical protein
MLDGVRGGRPSRHARQTFSAQRPPHPALPRLARLEIDSSLVESIEHAHARFRVPHALGDEYFLPGLARNRFHADGPAERGQEGVGEVVRRDAPRTLKLDHAPAGPAFLKKRPAARAMSSSLSTRRDQSRNCGRRPLHRVRNTFGCRGYHQEPRETCVMMRGKTTLSTLAASRQRIAKREAGAPTN